MGYPCPAIGEPAYGWRASPPIPKITRNRAKHLGRYVDEFAFRFNEGDVKRHTMQRLDSFIDGVAGKRLTYKALTH